MMSNSTVDVDTSQLVTVYIPTHNRCQLLKRAITSVLNQTYSNIEIIVVNDGSIDDTKDYLKALEKEHQNLRCFHQNTPKGACAARNIAIHHAKGQLITGLDDDDEFLPERVSYLVSRYDRKFAFVCTGFLWHYGAKTKAVDNQAKLISLNEQLSYNHATNQVMVDLGRIKSISGFDEGFVACQDYDTWTRLIEKYGKAKRVSGASYIIHRGDDVERITEPKNWLNGHQQFINKHRHKMSDVNMINQKFRRMVAKRERLTLFDLYEQLKAGLIIQKIRYWLSSNFTLLSKVRKKILSKV